MISIYLTEWAQAHRKLRDARAARATTDDIAQQLQGLNPVYCVQHTPWEVLAHIPRYLKAVSLRIDKYRQDPARDASAMAAMKPLEQRYTRRLAELKGRQDARLQEFRWLLEELRVSLFAQELRTAQPVSVKRLEKVWSQLIAA
jgi:ATP-dependent helicase HrpA